MGLSGNGASGAANQNEGAEQNFYNTLQSAFNQEYAGQNALLGSINSAFQPLLAAGPNQYGFAPGADEAMRAQATDANAASFANAETALQNKEAATDETGLPGGVNAQLQGQLAAAGAQQQSNAMNQITQQGYAQGASNFGEAAKVLAGTAGMMNPLGYAGSANSGGSTLNSGTNVLAQTEQSPWMGLLGGLGGSLLGAAGNAGSFGNLFGLGGGTGGSGDPDPSQIGMGG